MRQQNRLFVIIAILLGLLIGCKLSAAPQTEVNKAVIHRFNEALNNGNFNLFDELLTPDFVRHCQATPDVQVRNPEDYKHLNEQIVATYPDFQSTIHFLLAEGDMVAAYATCTGTQTGQMGPFPPSGKQMKSDFLSIFRFEDGKIAELWVEWDNLIILTQLGHFPPPIKGEE